MAYNAHLGFRDSLAVEAWLQFIRANGIDPNICFISEADGKSAQGQLQAVPGYRSYRKVAWTSSVSRPAHRFPEMERQSGMPYPPAAERVAFLRVGFFTEHMEIRHASRQTMLLPYG